jgi:hypothetical protein
MAFTFYPLVCTPHPEIFETFDELLTLHERRDCRSCSNVLPVNVLPSDI